MMKKLSEIIFVLFVLLGLLSCDPKNDEPSYDPPVDAKHTALVYMMAENSLSEDYYFDVINIEDMCRAFKDNDINGRLMIFYAGYDAPPCLMEVRKSGENSSQIDTLKLYDGCLSTDTATMRLVMRDVQAISQTESYGMIVWTHANGWLPQYRFYRSSYRKAPTSIGIEGREGRTMDIDMFAKALQPFHLDYIIFDACLMGSVEVMYELRHVCDHIIATPTETMGAGFPYYEIMPLLFADEIDYEQICKQYYNKYITGDNPNGTIALVETEHLDALADMCRSIVTGKEEDIAKITPSMLQHYDRRSPHIYYDLGHYMDLLADDEMYAAFEEVLNETVPYKAASRSFITININRYSGLSSYVPGISGDDVTEEYYRTLQWYESVYEY